MLVIERVFPILVVVPNATISNWIREFSRWAPHVRAVQYNGSDASRQVIRQYELYHENPAKSGRPEPKFHVLVATYEAVTNPKEFSQVYARIKRWEVLIVDEGQRRMYKFPQWSYSDNPMIVKSDSSLLFRRLSELNTEHRVIMTGTPLNNNVRYDCISNG
jgi:chromodomain-helicase-DNA-binding protein 4